MKKSVLMIVILILTIISSHITIAGGPGWRYNQYYKQHNDRHYGKHYNRSVLGGLIAGGLITYSLHEPYRYRYRSIYVTPELKDTVTTGSSFLLKPNGDCFLITQSANGNQILSSVPNANCQ